MRCLLFIPVFVVATILMGFFSSVVALFDRSGRISHHFARYWSRFIFWGVGIRVNVAGVENIPQDRPVIFAANHQSTMDIPAMFGFLPAQFRILAKHTLFLIPFLGWHLYLAGNIPIDRRNPGRAFSSVYRASTKIRQGLSLLVFLEGTRSRDGRLKRFKRGTFTLAKKLNVPIVPVAVRGTFELMPAGSWLARPGKVELRILQTVVVSDDMENQMLAADVREQLLAAGLQEE